MPKKSLFILLGTIILIVFVVGEMVLFTRIWDPLWNPFRPAPEEVLARAVIKTKESKTYHSKTSFDAKLKAGEGNLTLSVIINGDTDQTDQENPKKESAVEVDISLRSPNYMDLSLEGGAINIGDVSYLKVSKLSLSPEAEALLRYEYGDLGGIQEYLNQWIKIDPREILRLAELDEAAIEKRLEKLRKLRRDIEEVLLSPEFYEITEELPDEMIEDRAVYHYKVKIKVAEMSEKIISIAIEASKEEIKEFGGSDALATGLMIGAIRGATESFLEKVGDFTGDIWIDKKTLLPHTLEITKVLDLKTFDEYAEGTVSLSYKIEFSEFDKPVSIEAPQSTKSIVEVMESLFDQSFMSIK